jgi:hypothetical protein
MFKFSLNIGPVKLYLCLVALWGLLALLVPIEYNVNLSATNVLVLILLNILLMAGFYSGQKVLVFRRPSRLVDIQNSLNSKRLLPLIFLVAVLGFMLKLYILFVVKGAPFTYNPVEIRLALLNDIGAGQGGILSIVAGVLFPFNLILLPIYFSINDKSKKEKLMFYMTLLLLCIDALLSGGGTSITIVFLYSLFSTKRFILDKYRIIYILLGVLLVFSFAGYMWLIRLDSMYGGVGPYLQEFSGKWIASYSTSYINNFNENSVYSLVGYIFTWISYYFVHGVYELIYLMNNFDVNLHTFGVSQGYLFYKFFGMLGVAVPASSELASVNVILGHYQTFWGLAYIDFGYFFLLEAFVVGFICSHLHKKKQQGYYSGIIFYPFLQAQLVYSFLSNPLNGQITYIIFSGILLIFYIHIKGFQGRYFIASNSSK